MSSYSNLASISSAIEKLELEDTFHDQDEDITRKMKKEIDVSNMVPLSTRHRSL